MSSKKDRKNQKRKDSPKHFDQVGTSYDPKMAVICEHFRRSTEWDCDCPLCKEMKLFLGERLKMLSHYLDVPATRHNLKYLFHYTSTHNLEGIYAEERLLPFSSASRPKAVWFTTQEEVEPTIAIRLLFQGGAIATFVVRPEVAPFTFAEYAKLIDPVHAFGMAVSGLMMGSNPQDWYWTPNPVGYDDWIVR